MTNRSRCLLSALLLAPFLFLQADEWLNSQIVADSAKTEHWRGTHTDTAITRDNRPTQRWSHAQNASITLPAAPHDWSKHSHVHFWMYSHRNTHNHFIIQLNSENPQKEGIDYYHIIIPVNFTGWREFTLPIKRFLVSRSPRGLHQIDTVYCHAQGWENRFDPQTTVNFSTIELVDFKQTMMTNAELFDALDLSLPGLEQAAEAWKKRDEKRTVSLVADYFRHRTSVPWRFNPHDPKLKFGFNRDAADKTVKGTVRVVCVDYTYPNGDIDWHYNHTIADKKLPDNHEWQWQLNRMEFWSNLGRAYRMTKDETYARTFVKHLRSWTEQCPDPRYTSGNTAGSAWRTIECGIRLLGSWPEAYHLFLLSPSFTDEDLLLYIRSSVEQMRHLLAFPTSGNWLTMEMNGVYTCASLFPELKEAKAARAVAVDKIYQDIKKQFLPDGAQFELTPGYHQVALSNIIAIARSAIRFNRLAELPKDFIGLLEKAYDYNLRLMLPGGSLPQYNDSWPCNVPYILDSVRQFFPEREDFRYIATRGKEGTKPAFTSTFLPWAGYAAMRSSWDPQAVYVGFDAGPLGRSHVHQDKLNIVLYAGNDELIFDDGGGCYENSPFRRYATDSFGHNLVLVDGKPQRRSSRTPENSVVTKPIDVSWMSTPEFDYAAATYDQGYGKDTDKPASHTRQVLFLKPGLVLVCDLLQSRDGKPHTYQQRWQINSTQVTACLDNHPALFTDNGDKRHNVLVAPLLTDGLDTRHASQQTTPEVLGWYVIKDSGPYRPATTFLAEKKGDGTQVFLTLLAPTDPGAPCPVTAIRQTAPLQATITFRDGRTLQVNAPASTKDKLYFTFN